MSLQFPQDMRGSASPKGEARRECAAKDERSAGRGREDYGWGWAGGVTRPGGVTKHLATVTELKHTAADQALNAKVEPVGMRESALIQINAIACERLDPYGQVSKVLRECEPKNSGLLDGSGNDVRVRDTKHRGGRWQGHRLDRGRRRIGRSARGAEKRCDERT
jgi:hypothetical protein